ncbi:zinc ribbon domain-containing protein [Bacillus sp. RAR_GA_16]|uniref:zinc ribbon domain-containing protein n=1 Tax=Bacillus sp. RAR_GA_16 TaxID=2876774 RepID=UPI001CCB78EB|nr:hypothetical protein [Bacillus sp. RAR_GA_16]MCA0172853.1 hypothetical protein [Bacillus sp. RAR_GA_16]
MNWCHQCNRSETGSFCVKCGQKVARKRQTPLKKSRGVLWVGIVGGILLVLIGSFLTLKWITSPERAVERFKDALLKEDYEAIGKFIPDTNPLLSQEAELASFVSLLKEHPDQRRLLIQDLERQARSLSDHMLIKPNENLFLQMTVMEDGKAFFLFKDYVITSSPIYVEVGTQFNKTSLFINKEESGTIGEDGKKIGPFLPGSYQFETVLENEGYTMRGEAEVELAPSEETVQVDLPVNGAFVMPDSNYEDARLFINGKDTGIAIGDAGEIGPYPTDGSVVMHAEKKFEAGVVKSPSVHFEGEAPFFSIDYREPAVIEKEVADQPEVVQHQDETKLIISAVNTYLNDWIHAYENLETDYFSNLTPELQSYFEERFQSVRENNAAFTGEVVEAAFDLDSFLIDSSGKKAEIDVLVTMDSANHEQGETNVQTEVTSNGFHYKLVKSNGKWLIDSREEVEYVDLTNAVVY